MSHAYFHEKLSRFNHFIDDILRHFLTILCYALLLNTVNGCNQSLLINITNR